MSPRVSFCLFAFKQERFVEAAVKAALDQQYEEMELVICDDGSPDGTRAAIERALAAHPRGAGAITVFHEKNQGLAAAVRDVVQAASGRYLVFAAGDDVSFPQRVARTVEAFESSPEVRAVFANAWVTDAELKRMRLFYPPGELPKAATLSAAAATVEHFAMLGATGAYHREIFETFGPAFPTGVSAEDNALPFRARLLGRIAYVAEPQADYRQHGANWWLGTDATTTDPEELFAQHRRHAAQYRAITAGFLEDLATAERLFPARRGEFAEIRRAGEGSVREWDARLVLLNRPGLFRKLQATATALSAGMAPRRAARFLLTFWATRPYLLLNAWRARRYADRLKPS